METDSMIDLQRLGGSQNVDQIPKMVRMQSRVDVVDGMPSHNLNVVHTLRKAKKGKTLTKHASRYYLNRFQSTMLDGVPFDQRANVIFSELEKDSSLMEDNPDAEKLRIDTMREMPEALTLKRTIKKKLVKSVSQRSKETPLSFYKTMKYGFSIWRKKFLMQLKNNMYTLELWYNSLKVIEGRFGSGVATYFRFFRWLFVMNCFITVLNFCFVAIPQILHDDIQNGVYKLAQDTNNSSYGENSTGKAYTTDVLGNISRVARAESFAFSNIFSGAGSFDDTVMYYGHYANASVSLYSEYSYDISLAYFLSTFFCFVIAVLLVSISMAKSYRQSFIETSGGGNAVFSHKVFCSWDFGIATWEAANLKSKSIFNELKILLAERNKTFFSASCLSDLLTSAVQTSIHIFSIAIIAAIGYAMWLFLNQPFEDNSLAVAVIITLLTIVLPIFFSWIVRFENYRSPRTSLYFTLIRNFTFELVIILVLVVHWAKKSNSSVPCWETSLGQEVYRLILMDFIFGVIGTALAEFIRKRIYMSFWKGIGHPHFDIARSTLNLIYNELLLFIGILFSPMLPFVVIIKMCITFYIKQFGALYNCQPSNKSWRAAQTETVFLMITFGALLVALVTYGYVLLYVPPSNTCGPFRQNIIQNVKDNLLDHDPNKFWNVVLFFTKPGVIGCVLVAMCCGAYYLRSKAVSQNEMVELLREMLILEARDKDFLLTNISRLAEQRWICDRRQDSVRPSTSNFEPSRVTKAQFHDFQPSYSSPKMGSPAIQNRFSNIKDDRKEMRLHRIPRSHRK